MPDPSSFVAEPPTADVADGRLVVDARSGDRSAFEALYRRHVGRVFGLCRRLALEPATAEDLCQEVFLTAWRKLATYRGESAFGTWLYRLTVNLVVSEGRRDRRHKQRLVSLDQPFSRPRRAGDEAGALAMTDREDSLASEQQPHQALDLERSLTLLPPVGRRVFVLHDVEGYRHAEIGRLLGIEAATSRTHLHRARRRLREVLAP